MKHSIQNVKKAREMRLSGSSLSEISQEMKIPVSTLSLWFRDIVLSNEQIKNLKERMYPKMSRGRLNSSITIRAKRMFNEKKAFELAEKEFVHLEKDPFFLVGVTLYLMGGVKKGSSFQFTDSDPKVITIMEKWVKKYLKVEDILIKRRNYEGYLRLDVSRVDVLRKMIAWQKLLIKYYSEVVS